MVADQIKSNWETSEAPEERDQREENLIPIGSIRLFGRLEVNSANIAAPLQATPYPISFEWEIQHFLPEDQEDKKFEKEFQRRAARWKEETRFHSSLGKLYTHPDYVRIIGMGKDGIKYVLRDLEKSPVRWFYALKNMAGFDAAGGETDFAKARQKWLEWGRDNNHL